SAFLGNEECRELVEGVSSETEVHRFTVLVASGRGGARGFDVAHNGVDRDDDCLGVFVTQLAGVPKAVADVIGGLGALENVRVGRVGAVGGDVGARREGDDARGEKDFQFHWGVSVVAGGSGFVGVPSKKYANAVPTSLPTSATMDERIAICVGLRLAPRAMTRTPNVTSAMSARTASHARVQLMRFIPFRPIEVS